MLLASKAFVGFQFLAFLQSLHQICKINLLWHFSTHFFPSSEITQLHCKITNKNLLLWLSRFVPLSKFFPVFVALKQELGKQVTHSKVHSFLKQCLHYLHFMKTRSFSPNLSNLVRLTSAKGHCFHKMKNSVSISQWINGF